jgi:hypothetical protein
MLLFSPFEDSVIMYLFDSYFVSFFFNFFFYVAMPQYVVLSEHIADFFVELPWYYYATTVDVVPTLSNLEWCSRSYYYMSGTILFFSVISSVINHSDGAYEDECTVANDNAWFGQFSDLFYKNMILPYIGAACKSFVFLRYNNTVMYLK